MVNSESSTDPSLAEKDASDFLYTPTQQFQKKRNVLHSKRKAFFGPLFVLGDFIQWVLIYSSITLVTGGYNVVTSVAIILPFTILTISVSLVGAYRLRTDFASLRFASEYLIVCCLAYGVAALALYFVASFGPTATSSRAIFTASFVVQVISSLFVRRLFWFCSSKSRSEGKLLVITDERFGAVFHRDYEASEKQHQVRYIAAHKGLRGKPIAGEGTPSPVVELAHLLPHIDRESAIDYEAIVIAADLNALDPEIASRLSVIHFDELPVYTMESFYEKYWSRLPLEALGPAWPLETEFLLVQHSLYSSLKRLLDLVVALVLLSIVAPLMLIVALLIMVFDGFPVIYSQPRAGIYGRPFTLYKFRTMKVGSDRGDGYTREKDIRVSTLGSFLRKTRLDELPQLWNVFRGEMSMIGPRAEWTRLVEDYDQEIPHYNFRHFVRPGITGWAQVNYPYGASLEDTRMKFSYDLHYIRNFSIRLDAEVLLKTLHVILFGMGR